MRQFRAKRKSAAKDIFFKVSKRSPPGRALFICGNISEFGDWSPGLMNKLKRIGESQWEIKVKLIPESYETQIEYKFVEANESDFSNLLWEEGANRIIEHSVLKHKGELVIDEKWGMRLFRLRLIEREPHNIDKYEIKVVGDIPALGSLTGTFKKMKLFEKELKELTTKYWEFSFYVSSVQEYFKYKYVRVYREKNKLLFERANNRICVLSLVNTTPNFFLTKNSYKKIDLSFLDEFKKVQAADKIIIGSFPLRKRERKLLIEEGITKCIIISDSPENLMYCAKTLKDIDEDPQFPECEVFLFPSQIPSIVSSLKSNASPGLCYLSSLTESSSPFLLMRSYFSSTRRSPLPN